MSCYRRVLHDGQKLYVVGILADGSLINPNGYPEDIVRSAVLAADERHRVRRSERAKKAAETRRRRQEKRVTQVAKQIAEGQGIGERHRCYVCGRRLDDPASIKRGIGPECWGTVLEQVEEALGRHNNTEPQRYPRRSAHGGDPESAPSLPVRS